MSPLSPQTIERRLLGSYFLESWLGVDLDQKTFCPASYQGLDFDRDEPADVLPFTVQEVLGDDQSPGVGYVLLWFDEIDKESAGLASGVDSGTGKFVHQIYTFERLMFEVATPSGADLALSESYMDAIEDLFVGVRIEHAGPPFIVLRQLPSTHPPRRREGEDDGALKTRFLDVTIRRRERRALVGSKGVSLP